MIAVFEWVDLFIKIGKHTKPLFGSSRNTVVFFFPVFAIASDRAGWISHAGPVTSPSLAERDNACLVEQVGGVS